jgi:tetratricopeptide (TPR) repeat protein
LFNLVYKRKDEALELTNKCLILAKQEGFEPSIGLCYKAQGAIYVRKGELKKAKQSFQLSLNTFKKLNDTAEINTVQTMMSAMQNK